MTAAQLASALGDPRLGQFVSQTGWSAAVLNASGMDRFGTDDVEWMSEQWAPMLASVNVRKLSVVVAERVHMLFKSQHLRFVTLAEPAAPTLEDVNRGSGVLKDKAEPRRAVSGSEERDASAVRGDPGWAIDDEGCLEERTWSRPRRCGRLEPRDALERARELRAWKVTQLHAGFHRARRQPGEHGRRDHRGRHSRKAKWLYTHDRPQSRGNRRARRPERWPQRGHHEAGWVAPPNGHSAHGLTASSDLQTDVRRAPRVRAHAGRTRQWWTRAAVSTSDHQTTAAPASRESNRPTRGSRRGNLLVTALRGPLKGEDS